MKNTSIVFVAAVSLAVFGCKKKGGDCDKAIANSMELSKATMAKMPGVDDKVLAKMRELGVKNCQDDKWSEEAVKCMTDAKSETEAQSCYGKLTADQQAKMNKQAMELMPPPPAATGAGSAAAGSAVGSPAAGGPGSDGSGNAAGSPPGGDTGAAGSAGAGSAPAAGSDTAGSAAAPK